MVPPGEVQKVRRFQTKLDTLPLFVRPGASGPPAAPEGRKSSILCRFPAALTVNRPVPIRQPQELERMKTMKKAVIFDLDGTLWDATGQVYQIWNRVFERHPEASVRLTRGDLGRCMGKTMEEIGAMLFPHLAPPIQAAIMDECGKEEVPYLRKHGAVLYDGVRETVALLKEEYGLYIVSNCQDGYVNSFLTAHGFTEDFRDIEMSGRTGKSKGENIRLLMERNRVTRAVYVGDTRGDEQAARAAGIPFLHAAYGFGTADRPDGTLSGIRELPGALRAIRF